MSLTVSATRTPYLPAPEGSHLARCYLLVDLGLQASPKYHTAEEKVLIGWELDTTIGDKPFVHMQQYTARLDRGTRLLELLEGWYNKRFTEAERTAFRLQSLINQFCYLTLKHTPDDQDPLKRWAHVTHIAPLPKGFVYEAAYHPPVYFDLDTYTQDSFLALPEKIRIKINKNNLRKAEKQMAERIETAALKNDPLNSNATAALLQE